MRALGLLALAALIAACDTQYDPCFGTAMKVADLRVLAVRSDPPEVVFDPAAATIPPVTVSMLMADPRTGITDIFNAEVAACPQTDDKRCAPGSLHVASVAQAGPVISFPVQVTPALLQAALDADPLRGYGGIRVQVDIQLTGTFSRSTRATKTLLFTPAKAGYVPNHSFEILGLNLTIKGYPMGFYATGDIVSVQVADQIGVIPLLAPTSGDGDAAEDYDVVDLAGNPVHLKEHISYSLYSTVHGRFLSDTAEQPPQGVLPTLLDGVFKFQSTLAASGRLYVVARDGRGAVAWFTTPWASVETRGGRQPNLELDCE